MKIGKLEIGKKTIVITEITFVTVALIAVGAYFIPQMINKQEVMAAAKIKADNKIFVTRSLEEFEANKKIKSSEVAKKVSEELNIVTVNPYNKKADAYTFEKTCKACNSVEFDDALEMIILTTYDKKGELTARTVIKPPSFVTYNK